MKYKVQFETVSAIGHPDYYDKNGMPDVPLDDVPEALWSTVTRITEDMKSAGDQIVGLRDLERRGEYIRNVKLFQQEESPWVEVTRG